SSKSSFMLVCERRNRKAVLAHTSLIREREREWIPSSQQLSLATCCVALSLSLRQSALTRPDRHRLFAYRPFGFLRPFPPSYICITATIDTTPPPYCCHPHQLIVSATLSSRHHVLLQQAQNQAK